MNGDLIKLRVNIKVQLVWYVIMFFFFFFSGHIDRKIKVEEFNSKSTEEEITFAVETGKEIFAWTNFAHMSLAQISIIIWHFCLTFNT